MAKSLNFIAPVGLTGYGVMGYNLLKCLIERYWDISLFSRSKNHERSQLEGQLIQFAEKRAQSFDHNAPCLNIWHQFDLTMRIGRGKYVAWPVFELDRFTDLELHHMKYPDELIVCSQWAKDICLKCEINTSDKIHVVPLGIDPSIFHTRYQCNKQHDSPIIFLNVGKWEIRKGHDILGEAFNQAFKIEDNVELWLMPFNPFISQRDRSNWENMYLDTPLGKAGKIKILPWIQTHKQVAEIMTQADCGVFPSRAEGWNLEILEMMALGKPIITTNYSAHTEFCNNTNCMLIDILETEPAYDGKWFFEQGNWAKLGKTQIDRLVDCLQYVYDRCRRPGRFINDDGIRTAQKLTWDNSAECLEKIFLDNQEV